MPLSKLTPKARSFLKRKKPAVYKKFAEHGSSAMPRDKVMSAAKKASKKMMGMQHGY